MRKKAGHGIKFLTYITKVPISFMVFTFVHNANLVQVTDDVNTRGEDLIPTFQAFMRQWNSGIRTSASAICPTKTKWFLDFEWNVSDYEYCTIEDMPGNISIPD